MARQPRTVEVTRTKTVEYTETEEVVDVFCDFCQRGPMGAYCTLTRDDGSVAAETCFACAPKRRCFWPGCQEDQPATNVYCPEHQEAHVALLRDRRARFPDYFALPHHRRPQTPPWELEAVGG